jgi:hypothetical protein
MEDLSNNEYGQETMNPQNGYEEVTMTEELVIERVEAPPVTIAREESWRYAESEASLIHAGYTVELRNVKTAMVIAPNHPLPIMAEGLLLAHHRMPLSAQMEIILTADDREIVRERFFLPTQHREEVIAAHAELAKMSPDFLTDSRLRDTAMLVYFSELSEEYDLWYRIELDEKGQLSYAIHMGPAKNQEVKKLIEGRLQL